MKAQTNQGFTIIESLVAITILIIGVLGPMTAATRGITDGYYAQNQLIATHLAQEGLELLSTQIENNNNIRDADNDGDNDNDDFLVNLGPCIDPNRCALSVNLSTNSVDFSFSSCAVIGDCDMAFDEQSGFYRQLTGCVDCNFIGPVFRRTLTVEKLTTVAPIQVVLKSKIEWSNKSVPQSPIELSRYAFDKNQ